MHTVLIVDDHPVIRLAVRVLLEKHGLQVVAETDNGVDAIQLVREHEPDVVILDIGIPKLDGLTVISRIKSLELRTQVLVLTSQSAEAFCKRCIQVGARGFVNKEDLEQSDQRPERRDRWLHVLSFAHVRYPRHPAGLFPKASLSACSPTAR